MSLTDDERRIMVELEIERGDYNCFIDTTEEEIVPLIEPLKALIEKIKSKIAE